MEDSTGELFKNKTVAVTGGLGSIGSQISQSLLDFPVRKILILDNRETGLFYAMEYAPHEKIGAFYCDVRDKVRVSRLLENVDIVFHAAALKHVIVCEKNPFEAVTTNVIGTQNVIEACVDNGVEKMILISTDKAVNPQNVMGSTKLLAERLVSAMCQIKHKDGVQFGTVRFGNVLYSRGSVLEIWERQLKEGKKITVTNPDMTRFFMSVPQAVELIFNASYLARYGEVFILKMPSVKIGTLAETFLEVRGYSPEYIRLIGVRPGEKAHEELMLEDPSGLLLENERFFLQLPLKAGKEENSRYKKLGFKQCKNIEFTSNNPSNLLDKKAVKNVIKNYSIN